MKKTDLLRALQTELRRHDFSTFLTEEPSMAEGGPGVVVPGMPEGFRTQLDQKASFRKSRLSGAAGEPLRDLLLT
jgi:hypothetical protein